MFSGIVQTKSPVIKTEDGQDQRVVWIRTPKGWRLNDGESVCVEGVCSTVQRRNHKAFQVIYMKETLRRSTLGDLRIGSPVNLERSLTPQSLIGGHIVQGHVDATARVLKIKPEGLARVYEFGIAPRFARYLVEKGSVAIDGISLTVVRVHHASFTASILPYTLTATTLGGKRPRDRVNVELDILAKYVEKLLAR